MSVPEPTVLVEHPTVAHAICGHVPPTVSQQVADRSLVFRRRIFQFSPTVFAAIEYAGTSVMVVGEDGAVIVGVLPDLAVGALVAEEFRKLRAGKPIKAIVYNDSLGDNHGGVEAFATAEEIRRDGILVIAHRDFERTMKDIGDVAQIAAWRGLYQSGLALPRGPEGLVHMGAIAYEPAAKSYVAPNLLIDGEWQGRPGGVATELRHFPAESDDGVVTWFPEARTLVVGHVLFGDNLPQLYPPRGVIRNPKRWYKGIEQLIRFVESVEVDFMVPMHFFEPIVGRERIMHLLEINRDTLQFMADQGARFVDKGYKPDEVANAVSLPPHLAADPDLQEHYGRLQQHMRQQFHDYLGWFEGDPILLDPLPRPERASRYVQAMGGTEAIMTRARACAKDDPLWAGELLGWLIEAGEHVPDALRLKAEILRGLGHAAPNAVYRNWFLTSALELEDRLPRIAMTRAVMLPEQILAASPPIEMAEALKPRLIAEACFDLHLRIDFAIDGDRHVAIEIRRGVLITHDSPHSAPDLAIALPLAGFRRLCDGSATLAASVAEGGATVTAGDPTLVEVFDRLLEPVGDQVPAIALPGRFRHPPEDAR